MARSFSSAVAFRQALEHRLELVAAERGVALNTLRQKLLMERFLEFLAPMSVSQVAFAAHLGIPLQRVNEIVRGKRGVSPETAWLLAGALGTTPEFRVNLQTAHDLAASRPSKAVRRLRRSA